MVMEENVLFVGDNMKYLQGKGVMMFANGP